MITSIFAIIIYTCGGMYGEGGESHGRDNDLVRKHIEYLASNKLDGRFTGTEGEHFTVNYIADVFKRVELKPSGDNGTYFQRFNINEAIRVYISKVYGEYFKKCNLIKSASTYTEKFRRFVGFTDLIESGINCIGIIEGTDPDLKDEYIVVSAHHDGLGGDNQQDFFYRLKKPEGRDRIYNSANDNASGVAALLAAIEAIKEMKPKRSVIFVTFSGHETELLGSLYFVHNPPVPTQKIVMLINLDVIGTKNNKPIRIYSFGFSTGGRRKLRGIVSGYSRSKEMEIEHLDGYEGDDEEFDGGDEDSFLLYNIPSVLFNSGNYDQYHSVEDEPDVVDYNKVMQTAELFVYLMKEFTNGEHIPEADKDFRFKAPNRLITSVILGLPLFR